MSTPNNNPLLKKRKALINARLLDPETRLDAPGALLIEGSEIADIGPSLFSDGVPEGIEVIDCQGHCLAPGLIDLRATLCEPGDESRETLASGSLAAAAGGITTIVASPDTDPIIDDVPLVEFVRRRAKDSALVNILPMAAVTKGFRGDDMSEMGMLAEAGAVGFSDGQQPVADAITMSRALSYSKGFGLPIYQHCMDPVLSKGFAMNGSDLAARLGLPGSHPLHETMLIERDLRILEMTGGRWHAAGISTGESARIIQQGKDKGLQITAAVAPWHIALNQLEVAEYKTFAKVSPPLREEHDRLAMIDALKSGTVDFICSHHLPQGVNDKRQPFAQAAFGASSLESMLSASLSLLHGGHMALLDILEKMTINPAKFLGLDAGRLQKGKPADIMLFNPSYGWRMEKESLLCKSKNNPFDLKPLEGKVIKTLVAGETIFDA